MKKANIISETLIKLKTGTSYRHTAKIFRTGPTTGRRREIFPEILQSQLQPGQNRIGTEIEYRIHFSGHTQTAITADTELLTRTVGPLMVGIYEIRYPTTTFETVMLHQSKT